MRLEMPLLGARWKRFQQSLIRCPEALKDQQNALPGRNPSRLKSMAAGQKPVNADCIS